MDFLNKIKQYWQTIVGALLVIMTGAFLYERQRRKESDAIADNKEVLDKLNEGNKQLSANQGQLESEEEKRKQIQKGVADAKADDGSDTSDFFNKR